MKVRFLRPHPITVFAFAWIGLVPAVEGGISASDPAFGQPVLRNPYSVFALMRREVNKELGLAVAGRAPPGNAEGMELRVCHHGGSPPAFAADDCQPGRGRRCAWQSVSHECPLLPLHRLNFSTADERLLLRLHDLQPPRDASLRPGPVLGRDELAHQRLHGKAAEPTPSRPRRRWKRKGGTHAVVRRKASRATEATHTRNLPDT